MNAAARGCDSPDSPGLSPGVGLNTPANHCGPHVPVSKLAPSPPLRNKVTRESRPDCGGITVLEILLALSSLAVVIAFAQPFWTSWAARKDMRSAVESVESSILAARQAARIYQTEIVLHLPLGPESRQKIFYSVPVTARGDVIAASKNRGLTLPPGVRMEADSDSIRFNSEGAAESSATLLLVSVSAPGETERIVVR